LTVEYASKRDREKLCIRINGQDKPKGIDWFDYVKIKANTTGKSIICKLYGDKIKEIPEKDREPSLIRINEPLRDKTGVKIGETLDFEIKKMPKCFCFTWYYYIRHHPDDTIVVSTWLGIIAIALGILALVLAIVN